MKILYRHIIYQNFQKKISYNVDIFVKSNKIHTKFNKSNSATALIKSNKNNFKNTRMISNLFLSNFLLEGIMLPYFLYILFLEKNNLNKTQITPILKIISMGLWFFNPLKLPTHISFVLKKSFYLLSWKSLSCIKFQKWKIFSNKIQIYPTLLFI